MEELFREQADVGGGYFAITIARYDAETGVLVVDQQAVAAEETSGLQTLHLPEARRVLDTVQGRAQALRYVIAQADHWVGVVRGSIASA